MLVSGNATTANYHPLQSNSNSVQVNSVLRSRTNLYTYS